MTGLRGQRSAADQTFGRRLTSIFQEECSRDNADQCLLSVWMFALQQDLDVSSGLLWRGSVLYSIEEAICPPVANQRRRVWMPDSWQKQEGVGIGRSIACAGLCRRIRILIIFIKIDTRVSKNRLPCSPAWTREGYNCQTINYPLLAWLLLAKAAHLPATPTPENGSAPCMRPRRSKWWLIIIDYWHECNTSKDRSITFLLINPTD